MSNHCPPTHTHSHHIVNFPGILSKMSITCLELFIIPYIFSCTYRAMLKIILKQKKKKNEKIHNFKYHKIMAMLFDKRRNSLPSAFIFNKKMEEI